MLMNSKRVLLRENIIMKSAEDLISAKLDETERSSLIAAR